MTGKKQLSRVILHVDMNSFYASVEMAENHSLKGKPLAIAGNPEERKGIIVTCSYEARSYGIKTTMPLWQAKKLCPDLIIMPPSFDLYRRYSQLMFDLLREYTEWVEPVSIDEGYMDVSQSSIHPLKLAKTIQQRLLEEIGLPSSIGIAPNKFLAKMASDMKKPLGITILRKRDIQSQLWPLPVGQMHGIGAKTEGKLNQYGIYTIEDLAKEKEYVMKQRFGINGVKMWERASGIDIRLVDPDSIHDHQSVGSSTTLAADAENEQDIFPVLQNLSDKVAKRLVHKNLVSSCIQLTIRYHDRKTITRSKTLSNPVHQAKDIFQTAQSLWKKHWDHRPVRLIGVAASDIVLRDQAFLQLDLFTVEKEERNYALRETLKEIRFKHGDDSIFHGRKDEST